MLRRLLTLIAVDERAQLVLGGFLIGWWWKEYITTGSAVGFVFITAGLLTIIINWPKD